MCETKSADEPIAANSGKVRLIAHSCDSAS
jgi:hypothetical protein